jgi:hypothetical protein
MKTYKTCIALLLGCAISTPALAVKIDMTPGLWEHKFTMTNPSGEMAAAMKQMQDQLANMSPEERKMMETMMASYGVGIGEDGTTVKMCITQEDIDRGDLPQQDEDCQQEILEQTKNKFKIKFTCAGDPPSSGTGEVTFSSPKAYTGKSSFVTHVNGKTEEMAMTQSGKWLSADCGAIKPVSDR